MPACLLGDLTRLVLLLKQRAMERESGLGPTALPETDQRGGVTSSEFPLSRLQDAGWRLWCRASLGSDGQLARSG